TPFPYTTLFRSAQETFGRGENIRIGCTSKKLNGPNMVSFGPKYAPRGNRGLNVFSSPPLGCRPPLATSARNAIRGAHGSENVKPVSVATVQALILSRPN